MFCWQLYVKYITSFRPFETLDTDGIKWAINMLNFDKRPYQLLLTAIGLEKDYANACNSVPFGKEIYDPNDAWNWACIVKALVFIYVHWVCFGLRWPSLVTLLKWA